MRKLIKCLGRLRWTLVLALAILLVSSAPAHAQFPAYGGGGMAFGYPGWGYGGFYGYPAMGYGMGYGGMGYGGMGFGGMGYGGMGYGGTGFGYPGFEYYGFGYGNPGFYTPGLMNPLFGVGMTPLGAQSYLYETRVLGRRSRR
jgi:hypothetical protein